MAERLWMRPICEREQPPLALPFPLTFRGERWDCATNGCCLLIVRGATFKKWKGQCTDSAARTALSEASKRTLFRGSASLDELRRWARKPGTKTGTVLGISVDRKLVDRVLRKELSAKRRVRVSVGSAIDPVRFSGDGWIALVMPWLWLRNEDGAAAPVKREVRK